MAISQDAVHKTGIGEINPTSEQGHAYTVVGGVWFVICKGTLANTELKDAPKGSIVIITDTAKVYVKDSVAGVNSGWVDLTVQ